MPSTFTVDVVRWHPDRACRDMARNLLNSIGGRFLGVEGYPREEAAWLDLGWYETLDEYLCVCRGVSKGAIHADVKRASREFIGIRESVRVNHLRDIERIHRSMPERQGKPMKASYLKNLGEQPLCPVSVNPVGCTEHWVKFFGAFNEGGRLVAYVTMARIGSYSYYSMIIGHKDYRYAVGAIHADIVRRVLDGAPGFHGLDGIMYAGYYQGTHGLVHWKRKALFVPAHLLVKPLVN